MTEHRVPDQLDPETVAFFADIGTTLTANLRLEDVLDALIEQVAELLGAEHWSLLLLDEEADELYFALTVGRGQERLRDIRLARGEGIAGTCVETGEPIIVPDARTDPRWASWVDEATGLETESIICAPLRSRDRVIGVIELVNELTPEQVPEACFGPRDLALLTALSSFACIAIENARAHGEVERLTVTDDLSRLYNDRGLWDALERAVMRALQDSGPLSVIFFDLDRFKEVNDTMGHLCGAAVLAEMGQLLRARFREYDFGARFGGDEFVVVLPDTSKPEAVEIAEALRAHIADHAFLTDRDLAVPQTASLGVATLPDDAATAEQLIAAADEAMYAAKHDGRNRVVAAG